MSKNNVDLRPQADGGHTRPVGWSGDGGVRETMRVELTSGGGAFPEVWGLPHRGLGRSPSSFATFTMLKSQNIAYIYIIA